MERRERHRTKQVYALTTHQLQVERRESHRAIHRYALTHTANRWVEWERSHRAIKCYVRSPPHQLQLESRESHRTNQVYAITHTPATGVEPIKCMRSPHTSYRWREERVIEPIKCTRSPHTSYRWRGESQSSGWELLGGHDWQGPVVGIWPGLRGYTLLFTRSAVGFLMTTESQDLGLTSHPKDIMIKIIMFK